MGAEAGSGARSESASPVQSRQSLPSTSEVTSGWTHDRWRFFVAQKRQIGNDLEADSFPFLAYDHLHRYAEVSRPGHVAHVDLHFNMLQNGVLSLFEPSMTYTRHEKNTQTPPYMITDDLSTPSSSGSGPPQPPPLPPPPPLPSNGLLFVLHPTRWAARRDGRMKSRRRPVGGHSDEPRMKVDEPVGGGWRNGVESTQ